MKYFVIFLIVSFTLLSCTTENENEITSEMNIRLEVNESYRLLLNGAASHQVHEILQQPANFELSELSQVSTDAMELTFYNFKPLDLYTGNESVVIITHDLNKPGGSIERTTRTIVTFRIQ